MRFSPCVTAAAIILSGASNAIAGELFGPFTVDTGSHTCTRLGQEYKPSMLFTAPPDRFFDKSTIKVDEVSRFGPGGCSLQYCSEKNIDVTLPSGGKVSMPVIYACNMLATADCTNNPSMIGKRVGTECNFSVELIEFE